ncbi:MAG TPA: hypothetical protein VIE63_16640, partial [Ramlibacter sp.]
MHSATTTRTSHIIQVHDGDEVSGDGNLLTYSKVGAKETFQGDSWAWGYAACGDAFTMQGHSHGGNDVMVGGDFVGLSGSRDAAPQASVSSIFDGGITYAGDAETMSGYASGGNDTITGGRDSVEQFMGDAWSMSDSTKGGNDVIHLGMVDISRSVEHAALGDAYDMSGSAHGGADLLFGADVSTTGGRETASLNLLAGDAWEMDQHSVGGADTLTGGSVFYNSSAEVSAQDGGQAFVENYIAGDAIYAGEGSAAAFGNDVLTGGNADAEDGSALAVNFIVGDLLVFDDAGGMTFGNDTLHGGSGSGNAEVENIMVGDNGYQFGDAAPHGAAAWALDLPGHAPALESAAPDGRIAVVYGNDQLYGGNSQAFNLLAGDALRLETGDRGGNDLLVAGSGANTENIMVGDAEWIAAGATGGNDTLVSGMSNDD